MRTSVEADVDVEGVESLPWETPCWIRRSFIDHPSAAPFTSWHACTKDTVWDGETTMSRVGEALH